MLSEKQKIDPVLQEIADKIQAELPEELAAATHFSVDEKERLCLDFAVHLEKSDYPLVLAIIRKYHGDFGNRKEGGKDVGFFFVPKPKPAVLPSSIPGVTSNVISNSAASSSAEQTKEKAPVDAKLVEEKPSEAVKSPMALANEATKKREEEERAKTQTVDRCLEQVFEKLLPVLDSIAGSLELLAKNSEVKTASPFKTVQPQTSPQQQPQQSTPVQRSTRPVEGHSENGIVWVNDFNQKGEPIEKAYVKDNERSDSFSALDRDLYDVVQKGKKGLEHNGKWYWLSQNYGFNSNQSKQDYIGRKKAIVFPQGGRR